MKTDNFIERANKIHGSKYDYSKVVYTNSRTKVCIICPTHGEFWITPAHHLRGQGCTKCVNEKKVMDTDTFVSKATKKHNGKYQYSKVDMQHRDEKGRVCIVCPEHGEFWMKPANHLYGRGCPKCSHIVASKKIAFTQDDFIEKSHLVHGDKYDYSNVVYTNAETKVCIACPEHGSFWQIPSTHLRGCGCPLCGQKKTASNQALTLDAFIEKSNAVHNGKYDYDKVVYTSSKENVLITCPQHGDFIQTPDNHLRGHGCPKCSHHQSKPEIEMIDFLKQYLKPEQIRERDREILNGREIDICLPEFHIGIEYNGLHWHDIKHKPDINYHCNKMQLANSKGYRLIQVFEDEWLEHREIVLNKLRHVVNGDVDNITIGARKCRIEQINREIAKEFLALYHIQGYVGSTVYLGAYFHDELVGVMTFTEEQPKMWNLTRFVTKTDYKLPGLANKLFKYFVKKYEYNEIKSFLDLRWNQSLGGSTVYDKLGFVLEENTRPDYRYVVGSERIHKFNMRKQKLHKKYGLPLDMTEREMCNKLGFERIYDCGLAKYVYKNPQADC